MISFPDLCILIVSLVIGTLGTLMLKKGASSFSLNPLKIIRNYFVICGLGFYSLSILTYSLALKHTSLSVLYPLTSLSYVFIFIFSVRFLGEKMTKAKIVGITFIILGSFLVAL
jgi:uncharacterized membrane protein